MPEHLTQPWIVVSFDGTPRKTSAKQDIAKTSVNLNLTEIVSIRGILLFVVIHAHMSSPSDGSGAGALI